jgi:hypothetical protein
MREADMTRYAVFIVHVGTDAERQYQVWRVAKNYAKMRFISGHPTSEEAHAAKLVLERQPNQEPDPAA